MKICRIGILSQCKIAAIIYGGFGVVIGFVWAGLIVARQQGALPRVHPVAEAVAAVVIAPFAYALLGFFLGAIAAGLFNVAAKVTGGLEIEVVNEGVHPGQ